ncbi:hypothetical protein CPB83DRAFT_501418 [Crepidotus variabilis]|uniref:Uncharacterized protein n=1 Tax=Crepidotus variabilis TaxID=179855 RepID=A0A9P6EB60_9AGAR|nr:hypothetical protein CPB83DRAFT_501418 [Crepidotus variabilis]
MWCMCLSHLSLESWSGRRCTLRWDPMKIRNLIGYAFYYGCMPEQTSRHQRRAQVMRTRNRQTRIWNRQTRTWNQQMRIWSPIPTGMRQRQPACSKVGILWSRALPFNPTGPKSNRARRDQEVAVVHKNFQISSYDILCNYDSVLHQIEEVVNVQYSIHML